MCGGCVVLFLFCFGCCCCCCYRCRTPCWCCQFRSLWRFSLCLFVSNVFVKCVRLSWFDIAKQVQKCLWFLICLKEKRVRETVNDKKPWGREEYLFSISSPPIHRKDYTLLKGKSDGVFISLFVFYIFVYFCFGKKEKWISSPKKMKIYSYSPAQWSLFTAHLIVGCCNVERQSILQCLVDLRFCVNEYGLASNHFCFFSAFLFVCLFLRWYLLLLFQLSLWWK